MKKQQSITDLEYSMRKRKTKRDEFLETMDAITPWDEIVAIWAVLLLLMPASLTTQIWAFLWFRFFDMLKPAPIGWLDRRLKGGFGVMIDDIVAAFFTLLLFAVWRVL